MAFLCKGEGFVYLFLTRKSLYQTVKVFKFVCIVIIFVLLTLFTQIGGLVYLLSFTIYGLINRRVPNTALRSIVKIFSFLMLYSIATFLIVPVIAKPFNRVPLPLVQRNNLQPLSFVTCFLNRHYVRPALKQSVIEVAERMNDRFPGTVVNYLDASFPFGNRFPLFPHLSHNDGRKLDIAFCYAESLTGKRTNRVPSLIGYGVCEGPEGNEVNTADICAQNGYWQYSLLEKIVPQSNEQEFVLDGDRTKVLVSLFVERPVIGKLFIEPHLKARLKLTSDKIRFHGCQAVRHDDHLHVQVN